MKRLARYSDALLILGTLGLFIASAMIAAQQWQLHPHEWRTNFELSSIDPRSVQVSGMGRDGMIQPINRPRFESARSAIAWLDARTPVIVLISSDLARAYPLTIMLVHEVVNDDFANIPIVVTYCPLCNSAIVYKREIDGRVLRMGVTGNLYRNNFLMYDDFTESWWYQFTGEALVGDYTGRFLELIPSQVVSFYHFAQRFPDGEVLSGDERFPQQHYTMNPYVNYDLGNSPFMSREDYDERLQVMEHVLGADFAGTSKAYPFSVLEREGVVNDVVNDLAIVVFWQTGLASALDSMSIENSRDLGQAAIFGREVNGRELIFESISGRIFDEETGSEWNIFGEAIAGELRGTQLERYNCSAQFWFAWASAHPDTEVYHP